MLDSGRKFVVRANTHEKSRFLAYGAPTHKQVKDAWKEAEFYGDLELKRASTDGRSKPYRAEAGALCVRLPKHPNSLWLCVFDCQDHAQPMVVLTNHPARNMKELAAVLGVYFNRWTIEEMHRFAKQGFNPNASSRSRRERRKPRCEGGSDFASGFHFHTDYRYGGGAVVLCGGDIPRLNGGGCEPTIDPDPAPAPTDLTAEDLERVRYDFAITEGDFLMDHSEAEAAFYTDLGFANVRHRIVDG